MGRSKNADDAWVRLWDAINAYAQACGGDTSNRTISPERMNAVSGVERAIEFVKLVEGAETTGTLESAIRSEGGVWTTWVYECRSAIRHRDENLPWLPDLLKALGWQSGTIHQALNAVAIIVGELKAKTAKELRYL